MSATLPAESFIVTMIAVFASASAGETTPVIKIGCSPEYEGALVWSVIV